MTPGSKKEESFRVISAHRMTISAEGKKKQAVTICISEKAFNFAIGNAYSSATGRGKREEYTD